VRVVWLTGGTPSSCDDSAPAPPRAAFSQPPRRPRRPRHPRHTPPQEGERAQLEKELADVREALRRTEARTQEMLVEIASKEGALQQTRAEVKSGARWWLNVSCCGALCAYDATILATSQPRGPLCANLLYRSMLQHVAHTTTP